MARSSIFIVAMIASAMLAGKAAAFTIPSTADFATTNKSHIHQTQFKFIIGTSESRVRRSMRDAGYSEVKITHRGLTKALAEGCKKGLRYRVELRPSGSIRDEQKIGKCRSQKDIEQVRKILRARGFRKIYLSEQDDIPFVAKACRKGRRYQIQINVYGDVDIGKQLGRCGPQLETDEIRAQLRQNGYDRIKVLKEGKRRVRMTACQKGKRYKLTLNRRGDMIDRLSDGRCAGPIAPKKIASLLASQGYNRIEVFDQRLPRYGAEACKGGKRFKLSIGRYGRIRRRAKIGNCPPPITKADLQQHMLKNGFTRVRLTNAKSDEFRVVACRANDRMNISFSRYGEVIGQERVGNCRSPRLEEILDKLEKNGIDRMTVHIEGCKRGRQLRFTFDEFGEQLERESIGRCRDK